VAVNALVILPKDPELIAERAETKEDTKNWDRTLTRIAYAPYLSIWAVAGLDMRFGWSGKFALAIELLALVFVALGYGLVSWAMASNRFFSRGVRIQKDRGHAVATGGPYRFVRHPGYAGTITYSLATPLSLGSLWALIPAGLFACIMAIRTVLEDRTLREELDGYEDYARRVHYRLVPRIW